MLHRQRQEEWDNVCRQTGILYIHYIYILYSVFVQKFFIPVLAGTCTTASNLLVISFADVGMCTSYTAPTCTSYLCMCGLVGLPLPHRHTLTPCTHTLTPSHPAFTSSHFHTITPSHCRYFIHSLFHSLTPSHPHSITLSPPHTLTPSLPHSLPHTLTPSPSCPPQVSYVRNTQQQEEDELRRLREEVAMLGRITHPNIIRCLGATQHQGYINIFVEWMAGMKRGE